MTLQEAFAELQGLDLKAPGGWPAWVHYLACGFAAIVVFAAIIYTMVIPQNDILVQEQQKEVALRQEFEQKQQKVAALDAYKAQLAEMEKSFGDLLKQLPSRSEVANLINDISQARVASGLEEELFQPQGEVPKEFYAEIPNRIVVVGTYHEMGGFVSTVAALPRIVTIEDVQIAPSGTGKGVLRMSALAKTYRYLDEGEVTVGGPKK